jgi:hypothetical protein
MSCRNRPNTIQNPLDQAINSRRIASSMESRLSREGGVVIPMWSASAGLVARWQFHRHRSLAGSRNPHTFVHRSRRAKRNFKMIIYLQPATPGFSGYRRRPVVVGRAGCRGRNEALAQAFWIFVGGDSGEKKASVGKATERLMNERCVVLS